MAIPLNHSQDLDDSNMGTPKPMTRSLSVPHKLCSRFKSPRARKSKQSTTSAYEGEWDGKTSIYDAKDGHERDPIEGGYGFVAKKCEHQKKEGDLQPGMITPEGSFSSRMPSSTLDDSYTSPEGTEPGTRGSISPADGSDWGIPSNLKYAMESSQMPISVALPTSAQEGGSPGFVVKSHPSFQIMESSQVLFDTAVSDVWRSYPPPAGRAKFPPSPVRAQ